MEEEDDLFLSCIDVCNEDEYQPSISPYRRAYVSKREITERKVAARMSIERQKSERFNSYIHEHNVKDHSFSLPFNDHIPQADMRRCAAHGCQSWPMWLRETSMLLHISIKTLCFLLLRFCETAEVQEVTIKAYEGQSRCYHIEFIHACLKSVALNPCVKSIQCSFHDLGWGTYDALHNLARYTKSITHMKLTLKSMSVHSERKLYFIPIIFGNAPTLTHLVVHSNDDYYNQLRQIHISCTPKCDFCRNIASSLWSFMKINKRIVSFTGNVLTSHNKMIDETLLRVIEDTQLREFFPGFCVEHFKKKQKKNPI